MLSVAARPVAIVAAAEASKVSCGPSHAVSRWNKVADGAG